MKTLFLILCLIIVPTILAAKRERERETLTSGLTNYNTGDGTERHEELEADGTVKGHYSYIDPNGKKVHVNYSAGKGGFKATGNHFASFNLGSSDLDTADHDQNQDQDDVGSYHAESYDFADHIREEEDEEPEDEEEHHHIRHTPPPPPPQPTHRPHYRPKFPRRPNFKPVHVVQPEPEIEKHPVTTKFNVQHPTLAGEPYTTIEEYHTIQSTDPAEFHKAHGPISFNQFHENVDTKPVYDSSEHLSEFDTTKLLKDYHKNKPTVTRLPTHPVSTKFSIEDATVPFVYHHQKLQPVSHQQVHQNVHEPHIIHEHIHHEVPHEHTVVHEQVHPTFTHGQPDFNLHSLKLGGPVPIKYHQNIDSPNPHSFKQQFKLQDVPNLYSEHGSLSPKQLQKLIKEQEKASFHPSYEVPTGYHEQAPLSQKQLQQLLQDHEEPIAYHGETPLTQKQLQKLLEDSKNKEEHFRHPGKNTASHGQYHQFLKSQEDEKIEQQFIQEQLKFKQQHKQRPQSRPPPNKFHAGRKSNKRPAVTPGLGAYRYKVPYGFRFSV